MTLDPTAEPQRDPDLAMKLSDAGLYVLARRVRDGTLDREVVDELQAMVDALDETIANMRAAVAESLGSQP